MKWVYYVTLLGCFAAAYAASGKDDAAADAANSMVFSVPHNPNKGHSIKPPVVVDIDAVGWNAPCRAVLISSCAFYVDPPPWDAPDWVESVKNIALSMKEETTCFVTTECPHGGSVLNHACVCGYTETYASHIISFVEGDEGSYTESVCKPTVCDITRTRPMCWKCALVEIMAKKEFHTCLPADLCLDGMSPYSASCSTKFALDACIFSGTNGYQCTNKVGEEVIVAADGSAEAHCFENLQVDKTWCQRWTLLAVDFPQGSDTCQCMNKECPDFLKTWDMDVEVAGALGAVNHNESSPFLAFKARFQSGCGLCEERMLNDTMAGFNCKQFDARIGKSCKKMHKKFKCSMYGVPGMTPHISLGTGEPISRLDATASKLQFNINSGISKLVRAAEVLWEQEHGMP